MSNLADLSGFTEQTTNGCMNEVCYTVYRCRRSSGTANARGMVRGKGRSGPHILLAHEDAQSAMGASHNGGGGRIACPEPQARGTSSAVDKNCRSAAYGLCDNNYTSNGGIKADRSIALHSTIGCMMLRPHQDASAWGLMCVRR